ncbi:cysteine hydrolase [Mucilaginibacter achroorhodeus]|uniref:Cysteine hydrolase n=1 Tax=Mucilaginibacter achroorhodeus TaxID=2599294 RepID=A0A563U9Z9_9SPHI|nr:MULTISPECIES: isochorismatase family cysteine hydrolase [Mucilaginibacter]QXV66714.1 cysteine hydrolase [Mucilaginibacter sp. 21P]TWR28175.1 cysteine hydrolase [Mucilaginibacter achroorhodeus]
MATANTALLLMDLQPAILAGMPNDKLAELLDRVNKAANAARAHQIPVIYVALSFRPGTPEVSSNNQFFDAARSRFDNPDFANIHPDVAPQTGDIIVYKKRFSAFTGSDLDVVLRGLNVKHLVLAGVSTSGVVLSTTREAADKDLQLTILADGCFDADEETHRVLLTKVFPRQAGMKTIDEWCEGLD